MTLNKAELDELERLFLQELMNIDSSVPAAKLDQMRKVLERNNRLVARPEPSKILDWDTDDPPDETDAENHPSPVLFPFPTRRAAV